MSMLSGQDGKVIADAVEVANITRWKFYTKSNTVAYSTTRPAYITHTTSATCATTPKSCVMSMMLMPVRS